MADRTNLPPTLLPPLFLARRRVIIACTNCRKRKIRCLTPEETPVNPCDRCTKKGLKCEYITISNQEADSNKSVASEAEASGRGSSFSSPETFPRMNVANPSGLTSHIHPRVYPSNPPPNHLHGSLPNLQYRQPQDLNPGPGYSASSGYNGAPSSSFPVTLQPNPYLYPSRHFTPMPGYSANPGREQSMGAPYGEHHWERHRRAREGNISEFPEEALYLIGGESTKHSLKMGYATGVTQNDNTLHTYLYYSATSRPRVPFGTSAFGVIISACCEKEGYYLIQQVKVLHSPVTTYFAIHSQVFEKMFRGLIESCIRFGMLDTTTAELHFEIL
ncbi:hypothetical protein B0H19DRAFT_1073884 [Mycena capillaripes]|nr:hypothetical protein B0H19DRAFT_1073884 [Mycena capillaripes]